MEFLDVVNENDEVVGKASKEEIYDKRFPHRIVQILIFNEKDELGLQLRSKNKKGFPGYWAPSAGGHVVSGETYEEAAVRELEEETGIKTKIEFIRKDLFEGRVFSNNLPIKKMIAFFKARYSRSLDVSNEEVEKVEFFAIDKIQEMIKNGEKIHPELIFFFRKHLNIE